jgi:alginate O-acetyltransferase complex protein AlgI
MIFNTISYFIFLPVLFVLYYLLPDRYRWILLLCSSIIFYYIGGAVTIIVPVLIIIGTFTFGILIERTSDSRLKYLYYVVGILLNLGFLLFFKYINFFITAALEGANLIKSFLGYKQHVDPDSFTFRLLIPLGISYISFQAISYLIEIKRGDQISEKNLGLFATYLFFFPKLLSGPIERAHNFIPQFHNAHKFNYTEVTAGLKRILWGLFLKLVVANRLALYTETVFNNYEMHSGVTLLVASIFFAIQLFADFAGYTEIAIGSAQILGYTLMENFNAPFISLSITEFWRRWHISLTTWVGDYIYNPIVTSFRNWGKWAIVYSALITFIILGFWHGASWNFIVFGLLQGMALSFEFLSRSLRKRIRNLIPIWFNTIFSISFTFGFFCFSIIFFKTSSLTQAFQILKKIVANFGELYTGDIGIFVYSLMAIIILTLSGLVNVNFPDLKLLNNSNRYIRFFSQLFLIIYIASFGVFDGSQFIYFKF